MALEMTLQSQIKAQIAELIHARRPKYKDQPYSWKNFCEAAHVASLSDAARAAYLNEVTTQRGADAALHLGDRAETLRSKVVPYLNNRSVSCTQSQPTQASRPRAA